MHRHNSAEWAYVVGGHCQVTVVDPEGQLEVVNLGPGDLWYFPKGHSHGRGVFSFKNSDGDGPSSLNAAPCTNRIGIPMPTSGTRC
jgi:gentisate 1,2-dioxygenase